MTSTGERKKPAKYLLFLNLLVTSGCAAIAIQPTKENGSSSRPKNYNKCFARNQPDETEIAHASTLLQTNRALAAHGTHTATAKTSDSMHPFASFFHTKNILTDALMTHHHQNWLGASRVT